MKTHSLFHRLRYSPIPLRNAAALAMMVVSIWIMPSQLAATNFDKVHRLASECRSGKQKACDELAKIAVKEKDVSVRHLAVASLTDQALLAKIALEDENAAVRTAAVAKLTDQPLLARVAVGDKDASVRRTAVVKLTDQSLLAKTAREATDASVRSAAVEKLTDQSLLAKTAREATDASVRHTAETKLEDNEWNAAVEPFSSAKVEVFLQRYPNGSHAIMASEIIKDEQTIGQIVASGPGFRFVLPTDSVPPFISKSVGVNTDRGRTIIDATNHRALSVFGQTILGQINGEGITNAAQLTATINPLMPCGDLSVFVISGTADNIQGDPADPIRLLYSKQYGVIHIGGKGKIFSMHNEAVGDIIFQTSP